MSMVPIGERRRKLRWSGRGVALVKRFGTSGCDRGKPDGPRGD